MTEVVKKEEVKQEEVKKDEVTYTPLETKAMDDGWKPKDVYIADGGDEESWRPAKEFIDRGELFKKIEDLKKDNRQVKQTLTQFKKHYEKVRETEYERALTSLKASKRAAFEAGDADALIKIDDQIDETKKAMDQVKTQATQQSQEMHPEFVSWVEKNRWYGEKPEMREFADSIGTAYAKSRPGITPSDVLKYVEDRVAKAYPEMFKNPRRAQVSQVEGGTTPRKTVTTYQLDDEQAKVMKRLVAQGVLTEEQYIKDLKELDKRNK